MPLASRTTPLSVIYALRTSLSHLTTHLDALTSRLTASESSLASLQLAHAAALAQHAEQSSAMQALCLVWEGRWREERRLRDEVQRALEAQVGVRAGGARELNGAERRRETSLTVLKVSAPRPPRLRRLSHSSTSSSSRSRDGSTRRTTPQIAPAASRRRTRTKSRALVAHLAHDLQHSRAEVERVREAHNDEVARLSADLHVRQSELARLYASLDALLPLHALALAPTAVTPLSLLPPSSPVAAAPSTARARPPSVLDLPDMRTAAAHSRAHAFLGRQAALGEVTGAQKEGGEREGEMPEEVKATLELEDEVRRLENEIARLDNPHENEPHAASSVLPVNGSQLDDAPHDPRSPPAPALDTARQQAELDRLEAERDALEAALRQAEVERGTLERLVHEKDVELDEKVEMEAQLEGRVEHLERERSRLLSLLSRSEAESTSLQAQLASTHASLDALAARVHGRIVELQRRLAETERERSKLEGDVE
ncbi:uncharacterized protein RHOBADRAFT_54192 [Rhodotorula graminis WP1]|uniref:Uncharacterized protein n=1 Tax=Rhodotorula graminis (strain WP1) TaxID=578459 RepID=A0A194S0U7_RHOGW|nr:uncharacterized protein RHOBADRAFT_54192 [Rhodotorula graminis WP1]KPV74353.1 hypothetical protein RHOBADRAFT_54192 [Rhodotorula graminis WP1]